MQFTVGHPDFLFGFPPQLPDGGDDKKHAEGFFQKVGVDLGTQKTAQGRAQQSAQHRREGNGEGKPGLFPAEYGGDESTGEEEEQVHGPRHVLAPVHDHRQPQQQQASAAHAKTRQKAQGRAYENGYHRYRIPPHRSIAPKTR